MQVFDFGIPATPEIPTIPVSNIQVNYDNGSLQGNIHWIPKDTTVVITANIPLPNGSFMTMIEKVVRATEVVSDIRRPAEIVDGVMTLEVRFKETGNFLLGSERLNRGLAIIGAPFKLSDFKIEFDVYDLL